VARCSLSKRRVIVKCEVYPFFSSSFSLFAKRGEKKQKEKNGIEARRLSVAGGIFSDCWQGKDPAQGKHWGGKSQKTKGNLPRINLLSRSRFRLFSDIPAG
jgi:hypothetical protein